MVGVVVIVVVMVLALPAATMLAGAVWSGLVGEALCEDADRRAARAPGS